MAEPAVSGPMSRLFLGVRRVLRPLIPRRLRRDIPVVPVVRLQGVIGLSAPLRTNLALASVARPLERAFAMPNARAVALIINSPGGSPVQSHLIYRRIRDLAAEKKLPVIAFAEDVAASGGYMIACAADEIICDAASIVGSIGVVGGSFGFVGLIEKIGIERRLYTSGAHKAMLDPFLPEKPDDVERLKGVQSDIHEGFIELVKQSRGTKLRGPRICLVLWGILDRPQSGRIRACRRNRRSARDIARPLWRQGRDAAGVGRAQYVRPHPAGHRGLRLQPPGTCRGIDLGA